jgi:hypothetical protein
MAERTGGGPVGYETARQALVNQIATSDDRFEKSCRRCSAGCSVLAPAPNSSRPTSSKKVAIPLT